MSGEARQVQVSSGARDTDVTTLDVAELCYWRQGLANDVSHIAYHGGVCPYSVVAAILAGRPDPRDDIGEWRVDISAALDRDGKAPLSMNDRMHFMAKANITDRVKAAVRRAVTDAQVPHLDHVHVEMHYRPKTNRFRDIDNTVATLKAAIDGLHQRPKRRPSDKVDPEPYDPIIDGDDPRYLTWSPPVLHAWQRGAGPALWLVLRSASVTLTGPHVVLEQAELAL